MTKVFAGSEYQLSSEDCMFTKTLTKVNETEPAEIVLLLESKSMSCQYDLGEFDDNLIKTIVLGMENCEGDLKDGLEEVVIAV